MKMKLLFFGGPATIHFVLNQKQHRTAVALAYVLNAKTWLFVM